MSNNRIGRDAAILTVSKIITLLIALVSAMLLSRFRTLDEYGTYSQILVITTLASALFTLGLPNSTNYFLARTETHEEKRKFISVFYTLCTIICIVMGVVLVLTTPLSSDYFKNSRIGSFAFFLAVFPWTRVIISTISNVLVVYGRTRKLLLLNIINSLVSLSAIVLVQAFGLTFREYMILYLVGESCVVIWVYLIVFKLEDHLSFSLDRKLIKSILRYSIPIGLASLVGTLSIEVDKLMIGRFFDTESLAIYTNAGKELPLTIFASSFTAVLLPQMVRRFKDGDTKGGIEIWGYSIRLSYIIICFFTTACVVFAPQIISILYSDKYLLGVGVFRVYSLVMLLRVTYFGLVINSVGKTNLILYSSLASLALNAILNYYMYLALGFVGPAIATFLSIGLVGGLQLIYTTRLLHMKFRDIFPWSSLAKITLVNLVLGGLAYLLTIFLGIGTDTEGNIIAAIIGFAIMVAYTIGNHRRIIYLWRKLNGK